MAIPLTGPISIGDFNTILGRASDTPDSRLAGGSTPTTGSLVWLAGQSGGGLSQTAPFGFSNWQGYEPTNPPTTTTTTTAAPVIITFVNSSQSTGTSITMPSGLQQNDIVIIASMSDDVSQNLPSTSWINIQNGNTNSVQYRWSWKRMGATPDASATGLSSSSVHIAFAFRNVATNNQFDVITPSIATNTIGMPDPPSITTVTNNAMVVVVGFLDDDAVTATAPSGFTLARSANYSNGTVMAAYRLKSPAGTEDAGAFGGSGTDSWVAGVLALKPA